MRLYGTFTSPFVRRVRIVAAELGLQPILEVVGAPHRPPVTPLWKVPVAELDGDVVFDSAVIVRTLIARHGWGTLLPDDPSRAIDDANLRTVVDGALDAAINLFYLVRRDGADPALPYLVKQRERVDSALGWVASRIRHGSTRPDGGFGLTEVGLVCALGWMRFRDAWPVDGEPALASVLDAWRDRPSVADTAPTEG